MLNLKKNGKILFFLIISTFNLVNYFKLIMEYNVLQKSSAFGYTEIYVL